MTRKMRFQKVSVQKPPKSRLFYFCKYLGKLCFLTNSTKKYKRYTELCRMKLSFRWDQNDYITLYRF